MITSGNGAITLTNVDSAGNTTSYGATLDNAGGTGGITINGTSGDHSQFNNNSTSTNLDLNTHGAVTLNYVDANNAQIGIKFPP